MRLQHGFFIALATMLWAAAPAWAQTLSVTPARPSRDFGILTGDVFTAETVIEAGPGMVLDPASLPVPGPVAGALDVRGVTVTRKAAGRGTRYAVRVTYQSFVAPEHVETGSVPGYTLAFSHDGARVAAEIKGFSFSASPFSNDVAPVLDARALKPDRAVSLLPARGAVRLLGAGVLLALGGVLAVCLLRVRLRPFVRQDAPFAAAARELARLKQGAADHRQRDALLILHRAFDATAGTRLFADDLDAFFARFGWCAVLREDVEAFFAGSRSLFFGADGREAQAMALPALTRLSRALMRAERRR